MKRFGHQLSKLIILLRILNFFVTPDVILAEKKMAVVIKVTGTVEIQSSNHLDCNPLSTGIILSEDDIIRTGFDGLLIIVFLDDKHMVKIKPNMELKIGDTLKNSLYAKIIEQRFRGLITDTSKQSNGDFEISIPTSVASVKG